MWFNIVLTINWVHRFSYPFFLRLSKDQFILGTYPLSESHYSNPDRHCFPLVAIIALIPPISTLPRQWEPGFGSHLELSVGFCLHVFLQALVLNMSQFPEVVGNEWHTTNFDMDAVKKYFIDWLIIYLFYREVSNISRIQNILVFFSY